MAEHRQLESKDKPDHSPPRFDVARLRELAGAKTFGRGVEYHQDGEVEIVSIHASRVVARVTGTEVYDCELVGTGKTFEGECTCRAFSDWGFCKHLVATALATNDLGPEAAEQAAERLGKIRDHLRTKGIDQLVEIVMALAQRDPALLRSYELEITATTGDDDTLKAQFEKEITKATSTPYHVDYRRAGEWAKGVDTVLDRVERLLAAGRAPLVLQLLDHFFACMDETYESIDDSDGHVGGLYARASEIHLAACLAGKPDPVQLARELFTRELKSVGDWFYDASGMYEDVLGQSGIAEYRRLAEEAWQALPAIRPGKQRMEDEHTGSRYQLGAILERLAQQRGDIDACIAIRAKSLDSPSAYQQLAQLCLQHGRDSEALKWAEEGMWRFEDKPDARLMSFTADFYRRNDRPKDADDLLWRAFERAPDIELYGKLKQVAGGAKSAEAARDRALAILRTKLGAPSQRERWYTPRHLILDILLAEKMLAEAWAVVHSHGCDTDQLLSLAKASEQSHPDEALAAYGQEAERLARSGFQPNYVESGKLIARMQAIRKHRGATAEHTEFLAEFMQRHKAKRNLMKILQSNPT